MRRGAIIVCGGRSNRMGRDKATLPFGGEVLLQRIVGILRPMIAPTNMVVVAAVGQALPPLEPGIRIVVDRRPHQGPLEAISVGLAALGPGVDAAFVTGCDFPLLTAPFVLRLFELLGNAEIAAPYDGILRHCLTAVYRPTVLPAVERLLSANRLKVQELLDICVCRDVGLEELREVDPQLQSLLNINTPEQYAAALAAANAGSGSPVGGGAEAGGGPSQSPDKGRL
ncbi:MAG: molybdenum cofactor guanylyltransferase [Planctomycetaceae bacterium]